MKKTLALAVLAACAFAFTGTAVAAPFASKIAVADKTVTPGATINVTYKLNTVADTVAVELLNAGGTVVATSTNATKVAGANTASLLAPAAAGSGYRVRVTAGGTRSTTAVTYGVQSGATPPAGSTITPSAVFDGYTPRSMAVVNDQDSDNFSRLITGTNWSAPVLHASHLSFDGALNLWKPSADLGLDSQTAKLGEQVAIGFDGMIFGMQIHPDGASQGLVSFGQFGNTGVRNQYRATDFDAEFATDISNGYLNGLYPRGGAMFKAADGKKYVAIAYGGMFGRSLVSDDGTTIDPTNMPFVTSGISSSRGVFVFGDKVYCIDRLFKKIFRFSTAQVVAATGHILTEAEASYDLTACMAGWTTTSADGPVYMAQDSKGGVVALCYTATVPATNGVGIAYLGNGTETGAKTLGNADVVYTILLNRPTSYGACAFDAADNLIVCASGPETVYAIEWAGASSVPVKAPLSQNITVTPPAAINDWTQF